MKFKDILNKQGFTLLEILVAIALFAAITAMLYPTYIGTFKNMEITDSYGTIYRMTRIAMERISEDLESACIPDTGEDSDSAIAKSQIFSGKDSTINGKDADELEFISERHISFNGDITTGRGLIKYYLKEYEEEDEDKEGFILYRSDRPELQNEYEDEPDGLMLCEGINSINFTYKDEDGEDHDEWDSTSEQYKGKLPSIISVELEFINDSDPETPIKFITSVAIRMAKRTYGSQP